MTIFVLFVIGAATYGSLTADKKIILKQGGSAILALISILLFKYTWRSILISLILFNPE